MHNFQIPQRRFHEQGSTNKVSQTRFYNTRTPFKRRSRYSPTSSQARVLVVQASVVAYLQDLPLRLFSYDLLNSRKQRIHTDELRTRATFTHPQPRIPFFGSRVAVFTSNLSRLKYWLLRHFFSKEAMCKGSTRNGLLYAAKAVP